MGAADSVGKDKCSQALKHENVDVVFTNGLRAGCLYGLSGGGVHFEEIYLQVVLLSQLMKNCLYRLLFNSYLFINLIIDLL